MYTRASPTDILTRKSARIGQVGGQVGEDRRAHCPARGKLNGEVAGHADFRAKVGEDVRLGVGPVEFQLYPARLCRRRSSNSDLWRSSPANFTERIKVENTNCMAAGSVSICSKVALTSFIRSEFTVKNISRISKVI